MTEFKNHMIKKMKNLLKCIVAGAIGFATVYILTSHTQTMTFVQPSVPQGTVEREPVKDSPSYVFEKHQDECWTMDEQPKAELPGAAIVQFNDGRTIYTKKHNLVDAAFNEALAAVGYGDKTSEKLDVIALCI